MGPEKPDGRVRVTHFPHALRGKTIEELLAIRTKAIKRRDMAYDINRLLNKLETKKNLLLFFSYRYRFEIPGDKTDDILTIVGKCLLTGFTSFHLPISRYYLNCPLDQFISFHGLLFLVENSHQVTSVFILLRSDNETVLYFNSVDFIKSIIEY